MSNESKKTSIHLIAGGISGTTASLLCQPFDVLKTNMIGTRKVTTGEIKVANTLQTVAKIMKRDGIPGFWRGSIPTFWRVLPGSAINFAMIHNMNTLMNMLRKNPDVNAKHLNFIDQFIVGSIARATASTILSPVTVVKTRIEYSIATASVRPTFINTLKQIYLLEGRGGLFAGLVPTIVKDAPFAGLFFVFYNQFKKAGAAIFKDSSEKNKFIVNYISGALGGMIATTITHPFDVIRTRLQLQNTSNKQYSGVINAFFTMRREEGFRSLFRGLLPRILKRSIASGISWAAYEQIVHLLSSK